MTDTSEISNIIDQKKNIFAHVFNFDDDTKNTLFNLAQYSALAIIPVVFLNKTIKHMFPDEDEKKGNLEITIEIVGQVLVLIFGLFFIHRIITYVPTFSKTEYPGFNLFSVILIFLVIILSLQTKVGKKTNILFDRLNNYYNGKPKPEEDKQPEEIPEKINAPMPRSIPTHQPSRSDALPGMNNQPLQIREPPQKQQQPNFNQMFSNNVEPFVGGAGSIGGAPF